MHFGTKMNASSFGVKRSKFKVTVGSTCWKMHFLALLRRYTENYWAEFHQTFIVDTFWSKDKASMFEIKRS